MANALSSDPFRFTTKLANSVSPQFIPLLRPYPIQLNSFVNHNHNQFPKPFNFSPNCHAKITNSLLGVRKKTRNSIEYTINSITHDDRGGIARRRDEPISPRCAAEGRADCNSVEYTINRRAIAASLLGLLSMYNPNNALAASGGILGGRSFPQSSSMVSSRFPVPSMSNIEWSTLNEMEYWLVFNQYLAQRLPVSRFLVCGAIFCLSTLCWMCLCYMFWKIWWIYGRVAVVAGFFFIFSILAFIPIIVGFESLFMATEITSVIKLQVGLSGMTRSLQSVLNRIAETEDTSSQEGLNYILTETTLALLRHLDYSISAYSSFDIESSIEKGEKRFNQLSLQERGKFDEETLINVNNTSIKRPSTRSMRTSGFSNEYIVVTILVAVDGVYELPTINGSMDLNEALQKLGSVPSNKTMAVEVLWTPQNENDTLSERGLLKNYPLLKPL